jgi:hypothetical protein
MRYVRAEIVHAPGARVWRLLLDVEKWPGWTDSMQEIKRLGAGPLAWLANPLAGSRIRSSLEMESTGFKRAAETG